MMKKNLFIAFEGIDGSGKSTQLELLGARMEQAGHKIYTTCEPTDGPVGSLIRKILKKKIEADERVIAGLFVADRLDHLLNKTDGILKKLEKGYTVLTDRYYFSSYAYHGTHMPMDWVIEANSMSAGLLRPDLNIYINISSEVSMERLKKGRDALELYETMENLKNVSEKYRESFEKLKHQEQVFITDGNRPAEQIADDIWNEVAQLTKPFHTL